MKPIIEVQGLSKRYRLGQTEGYKTIRETLVNFFRPGSLIPPPLRPVRQSLGVGGGRLDGGASPSLPLDGGGVGGGENLDFIWALKDVSFSVQPGEVLGVIGRNGAGKSTLLKILTRITEPTQGTVVLRGRVASLLEVGTGFHPELTGRENVYLNGAILGMTKVEITRKFDEIVAFAEVERFVDTPVKRYSSGMYVRLAFAVAAHLEPEILLVDEVLAVGDAEFQRKCLGKMGDVARHGRTVLFVSHNMPSIEALCQKVMALDSGRILAYGQPTDCIPLYLSLDRTGDEPEIEITPDRPRSSFTELAIKRVWIQDKNGVKTNRISMGETLAIGFQFQATRNIFNPGFGASITDDKGRGVFSFNNYMKGVSDKRDQDVSRGEVIFSFPQIPLLPGRYFVRISLVENDMQIIDAIDSAISFTIESRDIYGTGKIPSTLHGSVFVDGTISLNNTSEES